MVEGSSGILSCYQGYEEKERPIYEPSKRRITWPNGAVATTFSADEPNRLRGPQSDTIWCDELASWRYPETWDMAMFGLRLGEDPRAVVTTTPRPVGLVKDLLKDPTCIVTRGSSYDNLGNLSSRFFDQIVRKYEGTRLGRQELLAEVLEDVPGALWNLGLLDALRVDRAPIDLRNVVVAIDPAASTGEDADETGIIVAATDTNHHGYVLADLSGYYSPHEWAKIAIAAYQTHRADKIVAERNNGGDMVAATLKAVDPNVPVAEVWSSRGKAIRAQPVSALYEQNRCHHVGLFGKLEDQMINFTPDFDRDVAGYSPDRVDALVWAFTDLMLQDMKGYAYYEIARRMAGGETKEQIAGTVAT